MIEIELNEKDIALIWRAEDGDPEKGKFELALPKNGDEAPVANMAVLMSAFMIRTQKDEDFCQELYTFFGGEADKVMDEEK
jgi:hypothetical protein